ncbi:MAG TPA: hypothetical protein VI033_03565 [Candidatus Nitrosopolaris sp.]
MFDHLKQRINPVLLSQPQQTELFARLQNKPFWIWNEQEHRLASNLAKGHCCFNHIIGLPQKNNKPMKLFDYEQLIYNTLEQFKHLYILKATGLGITEFMLRYIVHRCLVNEEWKGRQVPLIVGPNLDLARKLIQRLKGLFEPHDIYFEDKQTFLDLNGVAIEAFPSNHLASFRSLESPAFILLDESDYFNANEAAEVRATSERYIGKSDPYIVMVSTPNVPQGLMESIAQEPEETCIYKRLFLDYTYDLNKMYKTEEIEQAKLSPSFLREYNLKYLGEIGNAFHIQDIEAAITDSYEYDDPNSYSQGVWKSIGIDPGFGSSRFAICITRYVDSQIQVIAAKQFDRPMQTDMIDLIVELLRVHPLSRVFIDSSAAGLIQELKYKVNDWDYRSYAQDDDRFIVDINQRFDDSIKINPVIFQKTHKQMLEHLNSLLVSKQLKIHPDFTDLIVSLRTATVDTAWDLNKQQSQQNDILDALRLSCMEYSRA